MITLWENAGQGLRKGTPYGRQSSGVFILLHCLKVIN